MIRRLLCVSALAVLAPPVAAQRVERDTAHDTWTLRSGPVIYRLANRRGQLVVDFFGPASRDSSWSADSAARPHAEQDGMVERKALALPALRLVSHRAYAAASGPAELRLTLRRADLPLDVGVRYAAWGETGVITRELTLTNRGAHPLRVESSPTLAWDLPKGDYTLRYLWGGWGQERQLATETVGAGARRFEQTKGRSSNGYVPWLSLRNTSGGVEYLAELAWSGNWWMEVERQPGAGSSPLRDQEVRVRMGRRHDFGGALTLAPGDSLVLPRVAFTASDGDLDDAANQMHRFQRRYVFPRAPANRPLLVQFNSWYPFQADIDAEKTKRAADVAAELGAEVYILDSGWYSRQDWTKELGDYEVNRAKFPRGLEELSSHVRGKGMKFGLWVEIENAGPASRLFREHPDWCLSLDGKPLVAWDRCQLDFARPEVRRWARATIDRLVGAYHLDWIKIDYNIDAGDRFDVAARGRQGDRLAAHIEAYYTWLDEIRAAHPELIIESCASGGLRFDTGIMAHAHTTWISDNVDPFASLQLGYGCTLQFAPEVCNHWMVGDRDNGTVDPGRPPGWWDFLFRVPMTGQFGISSRVAEWSATLRERAAANVALYKRIRETIAVADVYHLTPALPLAEPKGWMAIQYVSPGGARSVLLTYRLAGGAAEETFRLRGLARDVVYRITLDGKPLARASGLELATTGLRVAFDAEWRAGVLEIDASQ